MRSVTFLILGSLILAFTFKIPLKQKPVRSCTGNFHRMQMYDINRYLIELDAEYGTNFTRIEDWKFGLLESEDLERAVDISMDAFFKPRLVLRDNTMLGWEKFIAQSVIAGFTTVETVDARISEQSCECLHA